MKSHYVSKTNRKWGEITGHVRNQLSERGKLAWPDLVPVLTKQQAVDALYYFKRIGVARVVRPAVLRNVHTVPALFELV